MKGIEIALFIIGCGVKLAEIIAEEDQWEVSSDNCRKLAAVKFNGTELPPEPASCRKEYRDKG